MPAFMVVSGFVNYRPASETKITRRGGYLNICKRRSYQLLLPYLLWSLIKWVISANHSLDSLINITFTSGGFFWFLWALWSISLIFLLGCYISDRIKIRQEIVIGLFSMLLIGTMVIFELRKFGFQYISYYFLFYAFGYYCNKYNRQLSSSKIFITLLFFTWLFMGSYWKMHELPLFLKGLTILPSAILQYTYRFVTAFVAIYFIISIAPKLLDSASIFNNKVAKIGQLSLGIYVVHLLIIIPMSLGLVERLSAFPMPILIFLSFIFASSLSVAIVKLLNKNEFTAKFLLGKL